jgi:HPt (histidine-containing phosphotransfer) domain-containing protein
MSDELLDQFLIEGRELTAQAGEELAALARAPGDRARLDSCFRAVHTLKGSVGLFDLPAMGRLLHIAEEQLDTLRRGGGKGAFDVLLEAVDQVDRWLDDLERTGALPVDASEQSARLIARLSPSGDADPSKGGDVAIRYVPRADAYFAGDDPVAIIAAVPGLLELKLSSVAQRVVAGVGVAAGVGAVQRRQRGGAGPGGVDVGREVPRRGALGVRAAVHARRAAARARQRLARQRRARQGLARPGRARQGLACPGRACPGRTRRGGAHQRSPPAACASSASVASSAAVRAALAARRSACAVWAGRGAGAPGLSA